MFYCFLHSFGVLTRANSLIYSFSDYWEFPTSNCKFRYSHCFYQNKLHKDFIILNASGAVSQLNYIHIVQAEC